MDEIDAMLMDMLAAEAEGWQDIRKFNKRNPAMSIKPDTLTRSMQKAVTTPGGNEGRDGPAPESGLPPGSRGVREHLMAPMKEGRDFRKFGQMLNLQG